MFNKNGFFVVPLELAEQVELEGKLNGWLVFRLPSMMSSKDEFFEGVRSTLPLDPILHSNYSWDALADSLWGGLDTLVNKKIIIVWPDASEMKRRSPKDFAIARNILSELPHSLANSDETMGNTKWLLVLQVV